MDEHLENMSLDSFEIYKERSLYGILNHLFTDEAFIKLLIGMTELTPFLITCSVFKDLFPSEKVTSLDFGGTNNKRLLDDIIRLGSKEIDELELIKSIQWPSAENQLISATLDGVPPYELLNLRDKEQYLIDKFRANLQDKLQKLQLSIGDNNYKEVIHSIRIEQKKQIAEVELLASRIKKDYLKKISHQVSVIMISAAGSILSAIASTKNPLALIGVGIGGSGISTNLNKLIETWTTYKNELEKMKEKDGYVLWKVHKGFKKET